jgi:hypothetical protein
MFDIRDVTARTRKIVRYVWTRLFHPIWFWLALALAIFAYAFAGDGS